MHPRFHFRALDEWLAYLGTRTHAVTIDLFDGDFRGWVDAEAARAAAAMNEGELLVLMGYSAGGTLVQVFREQLEAHGRNVEALVLMDPALAPLGTPGQTLRSGGARPEVDHAQIAASFMASQRVKLGTRPCRRTHRCVHAALQGCSAGASQGRLGPPSPKRRAAHACTARGRLAP